MEMEVTRPALLLLLIASISWGQPKIVAFGDSLTAGYGVEAGYSYPDFMQKELGPKYRVVNLGRSGDTSAEGLSRVPSVLQLKPAIVIVEFGGNDGLRGFPLSVTRSNLDRIIGEIKKSGAKVLIAGITLPPNYGPDYIKQFEGIYKDLAAKYKAPLIPFLLQGVAGVPGMMQPDGIHATKQGNEVVAKLVLKYLKPLL